MDDVTCEPGEDFKEWMKHSKDKLMERERKLCALKMTKIEGIVNRVECAMCLYTHLCVHGDMA